MFKWTAIRDHFRQMSRYTGLSTIIFLAGIIIGGINPAFRQFLDGQLEGLDQLVKGIENSTNPTMTMILVIFFNNAIKAVLVMYFGALLGILPIIFLAVNGMVLGYMMQLNAEKYGVMQTVELMIKGILPHGWIEIPAIIIACAYGIRFGVIMLKLLGSGLFAKSKAAANVKSLEYFLIRSVPVTVLLIVALAIAAVIESTVTGWILGK